MTRSSVVSAGSLAAALLVLTAPAEAQTGPRRTATPGPVIAPWGAVFDVPDLEMPTPVDMEYRVVFDVAESPGGEGDVNPQLNTVARFLNMHARAGVPLERMHVAVVVHGSAGKDLLAHPGYRLRYGLDNPNAGLVEKLAQAGVEFFLCGQTAGARDLPDRELMPEVTMALSAMTARAALQARGYQVIN